MRLNRFSLVFVVAFFLSSMTACSSGGGQQGRAEEEKPDYNETKSMVLDILHSKEGKDTLRDMVKDPVFKSTMLINEQDISTALIKTFNDEKNQRHFIDIQMKDPKFAAAVVKASKKEHEMILKQLIKDPDYQQSMLTLMKSPDYQNMTIALMQSPEYRQYMMKVMAESLQNPEFRLMFIDVVKDAIRSGAGVSKMGAEDKEGGKKPGGQEGKKGDQEGKKDGQEEKKEGGDKKDAKEKKSESSDEEEQQ
jgi:spore germination protein D